MLNEEQRKVVNCDSSKIVCIAGAGSGKTHCLIERITRLVNEGIDPNSILVLTFTRAAAFEMGERFRTRNPDISNIPEFRTFHGFCYHLISVDSEVRAALGFSQIPGIVDNNEEKRLKKEASLQSSIKLSQKKLESGEGLTPKEQYQYNLYQKMYKRLMRKENIITFDTLCKEVCHLFQSDDECIQVYKDQFNYVFVDEFQDTDPTQWEFIQSFKSANLCVFGDALQAIYGFRNADSSIIKKLSCNPEWTKIVITVNYRSTKSIVKFANDNSRYADDSYRVNMKCSKEAEGTVNFYTTKYVKEDRSGLQEEESNLLSEEVPKLSGSVAILARTNSECDSIKFVLSSNQIEYSEGKKDLEIAYYLKSLQSNEYLIKWLSTFLDSQKYAEFVRIEKIHEMSKEKDDESDIVRFYKQYARISAIKYRIDTVIAIRKILSDSSLLPFQKITDILRMLGIDNHVVDTDAETIPEMLHYIEQVFKLESDSDVYVGTIHSVKGLEYDNVILIGVDDSSFKLSTEENKNLYYVGITRARYNLYVFRCSRESHSGSNRRTVTDYRRNGQRQY